MTDKNRINKCLIVNAYKVPFDSRGLFRVNFLLDESHICRTAVTKECTEVEFSLFATEDLVKIRDAINVCLEEEKLSCQQ